MRAHTVAVVLLVLSAGCLSGMPASEGGAESTTPVPTGAQTLDPSVDGDRVLKRGTDHLDRIRSDAAQSIAHERLKRVKWFREWLVEEVAAIPDDAHE